MIFVLRHEETAERLRSVLQMRMDWRKPRLKQNNSPIKENLRAVVWTADGLSHELYVRYGSGV